MTEMTIQLPPELAEQLETFEDRIPEILQKGIASFSETERFDASDDERAIISLLASQPAPESVLALRPSSALQERASFLLAQSKSGTLSPQEEAELDRIMMLERLVRLAKATAKEKLAGRE